MRERKIGFILYYIFVDKINLFWNNKYAILTKFIQV